MQVYKVSFDFESIPGVSENYEYVVASSISDVCEEYPHCESIQRLGNAKLLY